MYIYKARSEFKHNVFHRSPRSEKVFSLVLLCCSVTIACFSIGVSFHTCFECGQKKTSTRFRRAWATLDFGGLKNFSYILILAKIEATAWTRCRHNNNYNEKQNKMSLLSQDMWNKIRVILDIRFKLEIFTRQFVTEILLRYFIELQLS